MLRVYDRALSDDEMLSNYIVDRLTTEEMVHLYRQNDVLDDEGDDIGIEKLRAQGKSVFRIVGDVELVNETNNKKFEVPVDLYFYSAYGKEYDFVARNIGLRIQGTSSTTYPRKNYRLYFDRREKYRHDAGGERRRCPRFEILVQAGCASGVDLLPEGRLLGLLVDA